MSLSTIFSVIIPTLGIAVPLSYYVIYLRTVKQTRQAQLFMQIHSQWIDKKFVNQFMDLLNLWKWSDSDDFWSKYGQVENPEAFNSLTGVLWYFEGVGVLLNKELIEIDVVDAMYSDRYVQFWEKFEPILQEIRSDFKTPRYYKYSEYLYNRLNKYQKKKF